MTVVAPTLALERRLLKEFDLIIALDEVGRGALAGPVAVGAAVMDAAGSRRRVPDGLRDSKMITEKRRPAMATRRVADRQHTWRAFASLVVRRIDIGYPPTDGLPERQSHCTDMGSHHQINFVKFDRISGSARNVLDCPSRLAQNHLDLAAEKAATTIDLGSGKQRGVGRSGSPDARRTAIRDKVGDAKLATRPLPVRNLVMRQAKRIRETGRQ